MIAARNDSRVTAGMRAEVAGCPRRKEAGLSSPMRNWFEGMTTGATGLIRGLLLGAGALIALPCTAAAPDLVFQLASRSVVMIQAVDAAGKIVGRGSGVSMNKDLLVTNCHVVARGKTLFVGHAKKRLPARLVAYDAGGDLCALEAQELGAAPARIGDAKGLRVGHRVYAIGTPEGFELTLSEGLISGLRESDVGRYLQISAPISEGSSGGGLFDDNGRLIGIVSFSFSAGQNLNFAAPVERAVELAKKASTLARRASAEPIELPASMTRQWRHPLLK